MSFQIVITSQKCIAPTYVSSGKTWSGYLSHPEQYSNIANELQTLKGPCKSTNLVEIQSLDGGAYLHYSSNNTPSYKNLQFW
jgi:hypothetical protein